MAHEVVRRLKDGGAAHFHGDPFKEPPMNDDDAQYFTPVDWQGRLDEQMAQYRQRQANQRAERADKQHRRNHGLRQRYAQKEQRHREQSMEGRQ